VKQARRLLGPGVPILVRMDSAYYGRDAVHAAITGGAHVSVTVRATTPVKAAIAGIDDDAWTTVEYPDAIFDEATGTWISRAEVAEAPFTAFASKKKTDRVAGRLVVRRIPDVNAGRRRPPGRAPCSKVSQHNGRPQELRAGAPALREVHRERRLARARGHRVQPHPHRRRPHRGV
jgi:hypothetical protein